MGMGLEEHRYPHRCLNCAHTGVIGERVQMDQERKRKRTIKVVRMFEPDRMSSINLPTAYEQTLPDDQYWFILPEQEPEKRAVDQARKAEVSV